MTKSINEGALAEKLTIASGADNTEDIKKPTMGGTGETLEKNNKLYQI